MLLPHADGTCPRLLAHRAKLDALVIDDLAMSPLSDGQWQHLYETFDAR